MSLFTLAVLLAPQWWLSLLAPGFATDPALLQKVSEVVRWMIPYGLCISIVSFYALIMQLHHQYLLNGFSPIILNLGLIITLTCFKSPTLVALAQTVFIAGVLQCTLQYWAARRQAPLVWSEVRWTSDSKPLFINFCKLSVMGLLILFNTSVDQRYLSLSHQGSVSEYYLCERIIELPLGIIVYSLSIVFASYYAKMHTITMKRVQLENKVILFVFYFVLPCVVGSFTLAPYLIKLFLRDPISIDRTVQLLQIFTLCLLPMTLNKIFVVICTIRNQQNVVIGAHAIGSLVNFIGDYCLYPWSTVGIAFSTMLTLTVQLAIFNHYCKLTKRFFKLPISLLWPAFLALLIIVAGSHLFEYIDQQFVLKKISYLFILVSIVSISTLAYLACIYRHIKYIHERFVE
jgi:putative peptidoglycan lipid II flippase